MIRFGIIKKTVKSFLVRVMGLGGETENRFISPKGLYSKPRNEKALVINLANGTNQDVVIALQKDVELQDGDVYLTDDKNFIHFKFKESIIEVQGDTVFNDNVKIKKDLRVIGTIIADVDVITNGVSLKGHPHIGNLGTPTEAPISTI